MMYAMDDVSVGRVADYFARIGRQLAVAGQRESFATYAFGLLGDGERKSVEPIAARASAEPEATCRTHDRLLHFVRESPWEDRAVRREAARYVVDILSEREPVHAWLIDDTGFLKQGRQSPGVHRQYTGSAGKVTNCQIGVSLSVATATEQVPIDFELYLPEEWTNDEERRRKARIPDSVAFKTKIDLALAMISRAVDDKIPGEVVLADAAYGRSHDFRETVRVLGLDYAVAVDAPTRVWLLDARGQRRRDAATVQDIGLAASAGAFRRVIWRDGTKGKMASRFIFRRVKLAHDARISGTQGRARARSLRGSELRRVASSCLGRALLLRLRRGRARPSFFPLGPTDA